MRTYRLEATVSNGGTVTIKGLPFRAGDKVEVVVSGEDGKEGKGRRYPLRGKRIRYTRPFEGVAETDWDALR